jgi:CRISPR-associated protein Cmr2
MVEIENKRSIEIAIAWCLAWGNSLQPQVALDTLAQMRLSMLEGREVPVALQSYVEQAQALEHLNYPQTLDGLKAVVQENSGLWNARIGLVYGGATKIKQYVFEASKLQDIRGASALLDRINLVDLPAFFGEKNSVEVEQWLDKPENFPGLRAALIPELIIYSTGGNILAFCPAAYVHQLANAIEKRYTQETLTANSCAVGDTFRFLELRFGLLKDPIEQTNWLEWYRDRASEDLVKAYYGEPKPDLAAQFERRKSFNELVGKLATRFNQRRSGHDWTEEERPSRRYPPMFETHPYVRRDNTDKRSAVRQVEALPNAPWFSETTARKRLVGQRAKREDQSNHWFRQAGFTWEAGQVDSWVQRYQAFLSKNPSLNASYNPGNKELQEARSLREVGNASKGFVAYIYADGNNMGGYIQKITTADQYKTFSKVVFKATEQSVYHALARHLRPHKLHNIDDAETRNRDGNYVHPFEILTIGGDDVMLVVPANQALAIAKTISEEFERILLELDSSLAIESADLQRPQKDIHRYQPTQAAASRCQLSMSAGVLITANDTPIYYAENLTNQLLKSAKKKAKDLKRDLHYHGGTIDFLVMKSVTMLSSKVGEFRESGLVIDGKPKLKLYGAPYTLHEIGGLIETAKALKVADFPRSQLYQIRSLLERGKNTAMLNYRYFRVRLGKDKQRLLEESFENAWCQPKDSQNGGNLAPWMSLQADSGTIYETIWRELVDLYPFIDDKEQTEQAHTSAMSTQANGGEQ